MRNMLIATGFGSGTGSSPLPQIFPIQRNGLARPRERGEPVAIAKAGSQNGQNLGKRLGNRKKQPNENKGDKPLMLKAYPVAGNGSIRFPKNGSFAVSY